MTTIREIALEVGKSKTAISKTIQKLGLQSSLQKSGNKLLVPDNVYIAILEEFRYTSNSKTNEFLQLQTAFQKLQIENSFLKDTIDNLKQTKLQLESDKTNLINDKEMLFKQITELTAQNEYLIKINSLGFFARRKFLKSNNKEL